MRSSQLPVWCCIDMQSSETSMSSGNGTPSCHVTMEMQICATQGWPPESHKPAHVYEKGIFGRHQWCFFQSGLAVYLCFSLFVLSYWLQLCSCLWVRKSRYSQVKIIYITLWLMRGKNSPFLSAVKIPTFGAEGPEFPRLYIQSIQEVPAHEDMK